MQETSNKEKVRLHSFIINLRCGRNAKSEEFKTKLSELSKDGLIWFFKWCYSGEVEDAIRDFKVLKELFYFFREFLSDKTFVIDHIIQLLDQEISNFDDDTFRSEYENAIDNHDAPEIVYLFHKQDRIDLKHDPDLRQKVIKHKEFFKSFNELKKSIPDILSKENLKDLILDDYKKDEKTLIDERTDADLTFNFKNDGIIQAHRAIIYERCIFLREFVSGTEPIDSIDIEERFGIGKSEFEIIVKFLYTFDTSSINLDPDKNVESLINLYTFLEKYQEDEIMNMLHSHIKKLILDESILDSSKLSYLFNVLCSDLDKYDNVIQLYISNLENLRFDMEVLNEETKIYLSILNLIQ